MKNNLIGISGKIGSGKDTFADIFRLLLANPGLSDTTIAHFIMTKTESVNKAPWSVKKFAGKLKEVASLLTGIPVHMFEDQEFKKTLLGNEWGTVQKTPLNAIEPFENTQFLVLMSVREFLQKLGTDAMRNGLHTNTWVNATFANYNPKSSNWLITDVRFPNELKAIHQRDGLTVRVERPDAGVADKTASAHPSETALDDAKFDHVIVNNGSIEEYVSKIRNFCVEFGYLESIGEDLHNEGFH